MDLLDVVLDYDCNLGCTYCTITDAMRRRSLSAKAVARHIDAAAAAGCTALSLTGGEPTIRPDLLGLVRHAHRRGFSDIKVQTNGLLFATAENVEKALDAGVTSIGVSVHGHDGQGPAAYEAIVRAPKALPDGAHPLMLRALDNLVAAEVAGRLSLTCDLILMASTVQGVLAGLKDLQSRGVRRFNLWLVSLTDRNAAYPESLPRITEAAGVARACFDHARACAQAGGDRLDVASLHIPRCLLPGYEDHVRHPGEGLDVQVVTPDASFQLSESRLTGGVKPPTCSGCVWFDRCSGLREDYVAQFGAGELPTAVAAK